MNKKEAIEFIRNSTYVDSEVEYMDGGMNEYERRIIENRGELYEVNFCNGHLTEVYIDRKGYLKGVYEILPVEKVVKMIEKTSYIRKKKNDNSK